MKFKCECGQEVEGADMMELKANALKHLQDVHPEKYEGMQNMSDEDFKKMVDAQNSQPSM